MDASSAVRRDLQRKYEKIAPWYDLAEGLAEVIGLRRLRARLLRRAFGRVLEVAAGTGENFRYYPRGCRVTGVDLSHPMLRIARKKSPSRDLLVMDAEKLAFPNATFDTVVSTMSTCTFPDPVAALREMHRVCRAGGRILLLEHGRSSRASIGAWQDRHAEGHARRLGCHWNREPLDHVRAAGLSPCLAQRTFFGIVHRIEIAV